MWKTQSKYESHLPVIDSQSYLGTMQTIEAQSEFSIDLKSNDNQSLICKIFMLSIELERKQIIIAQQSQMQSSAFEQFNQLSIKYHKLIEQNKMLVQNVNILKVNIQSIQRVNRQMEGFKNEKQYTSELQVKIQKMESKIKRLEQQRIEADEHITRLKVQNSMMSFDKAKLQGSDKNRIRDLQQELQHQKHKIQTEKKVNAELTALVDNYTMEIRKLKERQGYLTRSYQQQIRILEADAHHSENLKRSQFSTTEEKIILISQQVHRLQGQVQQLRKQLRQKVQLVQIKNMQIRNLGMNIECIQNQQRNFQKQVETHVQIIQTRDQQIIQYKTQLKELKKDVKRHKDSTNQMTLELSQRENEVSLKNHEIMQLKRQISDLNDQVQYQQNQLKKTRKRDNSIQECQKCKVFSSKTTIQQPYKSVIDLETLIQQTEKLQISNKKVETLLNINQNSTVLINQRTYYSYD